MSTQYKSFIYGGLFIIILLLTIGSQSVENEKALERRVTALENRVFSLEKRLNQYNRSEYSSPTNSDTPSKNGWRQIKQGMTKTQIQRILGEPGKVSTYGSIVYWYYGSGYVKFNDRGVDGWSEP